MHNRCTPRQRRVLALRMQHNALKCAKMRSRSTKMRCEMHELNAPLWTECRQNAKKNAENAQKCTSQKRYQFVAKTVLIPRRVLVSWPKNRGRNYAPPRLLMLSFPNGEMASSRIKASAGQLILVTASGARTDRLGASSGLRRGQRPPP